MKTPLRVWNKTALSFAILGLALSFGLEAQEEAAAQADGGSDQPFIDVVDVNVINVDVYVTDKKGNRITGLKRDDFELLEDGKPVTVTNFYAVEGGRPIEGGVEPKPPAEGEERAPRLNLRQQQLETPEDQKLSLILYFDNLFLKPFNRNKVVRQTRQFIYENVNPGDRVMLVTFDRSLHVRHPFTTDMRAIADALHEIEILSGFAVQADSARRDVMRRFEDAPTVIEAEGHIDLYSQSLHFDVETTIRNLKEMVRSLAGLPGRKAILHVSDGIPMTAGEDLYAMLDSRFGDDAAGGSLRARRYSVRRRIRELTANANANRVTFYTLEAAGLRSHTSLSAEYGGSRGTDGVVAGSRIEADAIRMQSNQETLMMMAHDTGGLATLGTNNLAGGLSSMAEDFRNYYSLGYSSANSGDGRYHDIEVRVKRKGWQVRHRTGYRDKTPETHLSEGTLAALLYNLDSNPLGIELLFESARYDDKDHWLLPIEVRVPLGNATLIPQVENHLGRLRFSVAVIDEDGRMSPVEQTAVPLSIPLDQIEVARKQYYVYTVELRMRRGRQKVAVGVRDELAAESSYTRRPIQIGRS
ncbi:MAG: VWA domain-containing protein [Acidobacteriota bacterium]